ncbi:MAG: hypothetical protein RLY93_02920 [Sumerlaeia bacterium]
MVRVPLRTLPQAFIHLVVLFALLASHLPAQGDLAGLLDEWEGTPKEDIADRDQWIERFEVFLSMPHAEADEPHARMALGGLYLEEGQYAAARDQFDRVIDHPEAYPEQLINAHDLGAKSAFEARAPLPEVLAYYDALREFLPETVGMQEAYRNTLLYGTEQVKGEVAEQYLAREVEQSGPSDSARDGLELATSAYRRSADLFRERFESGQVPDGFSETLLRQKFIIGLEKLIALRDKADREWRLFPTTEHQVQNREFALNTLLEAASLPSGVPQELGDELYDTAYALYELTGDGDAFVANVNLALSISEPGHGLINKLTRFATGATDRGEVGLALPLLQRIVTYQEENFPEDHETYGTYKWAVVALIDTHYRLGNLAAAEQVGEKADRLVFEGGYLQEYYGKMEERLGKSRSEAVGGLGLEVRHDTPPLTKTEGSEEELATPPSDPAAQPKPAIAAHSASASPPGRSRMNLLLVGFAAAGAVLAVALFLRKRPATSSARR